MQPRLGALTGILPGGDVGKTLVIALGLAVPGLMLLAKVSAARLLAMECVSAHQLAELQEVGDAIRLLQRLIQFGVAPGHHHVLPELGANLRNALQRLSQSRGGPCHPTLLPHEGAKLAME